MNVASDLGILSSGEWTPCSAVDVYQVDPSAPRNFELGSKDTQAMLGHIVLGPDLASGQ